MTQAHDRGVLGHRIETAFHRFGLAVVRHRWLAIAGPLLLTGWLLTWLPQLSIDNSTESFLRPDDPTMVRYDAFREAFSRDDRVIFALAPPDVFDPVFLEKLRRFHLALEREVPYVERVTSLFNARTTRGDGDRLIVEDLLPGWLEAWPDDLSALAGLEARVLSNPLYVNTLVSEDASLTTVVLEPFTFSTLQDEDGLTGFDADGAAEAPAATLTDAESDELMAAVHGVVARFEASDFNIHVGGPLPMTDHINRMLARDMGVFMPVTTVVMFTLLLVLFRRLSGALMPTIVVLLSLCAAIGAMVALEIPGSTAVQILPVFLLAVGVCDAIHILTITYQRLDAGDEKGDAIAYAIGHSGLAVVMTSLTTAAGMASFISAEMVPVAQLGIVAPIGVMLALAYTLVLLPALLAISPLRPPRSRARGASGRLARAIVRVGDVSAEHPRVVVAGAAAFALLCLAGALQARFSHLALAWFDESDPLRVSAELIDERLRGSLSLEAVIHTDRENGLHEPALLARMEQAGVWAEGLQAGDLFIGKSLSLVDVVKETHQALNGGDPAYRVVPGSRELVAQELLLFESGGEDDLEELVDGGFATARMSLRAPFVDALLYGPFIEEVRAGLQQRLGDDVEVEMTGFMPVLAGVVRAVIHSMARSYLIALVVITPLMVLLLRDPKLGLLSMVPNLLPVLFTLAVMGWLDLRIDSTTMMIGAMVIGLAVDDTIHFMHKFRLYFAQSGDARRAIRDTLSSTGTALLFTTLVLTSGFAVFVFGSMTNTRVFGLLAALATMVALVADVVLGPALLVLATRRQRARAAAAPTVETVPGEPSMG